MPDVDKLFHDYMQEHRSGAAADPAGYLGQLEGGDRVELLALIDAYLAHAPGEEWDPKAFAGSRAEQIANRIADDWEAEPVPAGWAQLLPSLRDRARIKRAELVERLAAGLGFPAEASRVAAYYHQMEGGQLPAEGVSDTVLEVLGGIVGESVERLREAGSVITAGLSSDAAEGLVIHARKAVQDPAFDPSPAAPTRMSSAAEAAEPSEAEREIDRLFTGGPGV